MFSGIIEGKAVIHKIENNPDLTRLTIIAPVEISDVKLGDSIALNGVCLTVVEKKERQLTFELAPETLRKTSFTKRVDGDFLNFERSLCVGDRIHGHIVSGHVDGVGVIDAVTQDGETTKLTLIAPSNLRGLIASKGSIAIDGVSLTVGEAHDDHFSVYIIPHTLSVTTLGSLQKGSIVNLEIDMLARYVQSVLLSRQ